MPLRWQISFARKGGRMMTADHQERGGATGYLHWSEAGGPNECEHGYAEGIPCPHCDSNPKIIALLAQLAQANAQIVGLDALIDRGLYDEIERLTAERDQARAQCERMQQVVEAARGVEQQHLNLVARQAAKMPVQQQKWYRQAHGLGCDVAVALAALDQQAQFTPGPA